MDIVSEGRLVVRIEAQALEELANAIDAEFELAVNAVLSTPGKVVCTGIGKSGHVARKVAATLSSTGSPAFFMHPGEAVHGDMGALSGDDTIVAFSNSGETAELLRFLRRVEVPIIAVTGRRESSIGKLAQVDVFVGQFEEACPLGLAPSASTTAMLALGDALALTAMKARGFSMEAFRERHPGGLLGAGK